MAASQVVPILSEPSAANEEVHDDAEPGEVSMASGRLRELHHQVEPTRCT